MVRLIAILVGLFFSGWLVISFFMGAAAYISEPPMENVEHDFHKHPRSANFASEGPLGHYDRQQLQRGFQVYKEVCAACHGLRLVAFRNLEDLGYSEPEVKAIAAQWPIETPTINPETGEPATRTPIAPDKFPDPYANEVAARAANNNALPPDLSLIAKARHDGGNYVYSLLTGYRNADSYKNEEGKALPEANKPGKGLYFNPYFANLNIAMPPPITSDGQVTYADGTKATVDQMAKDVSAFLTWTAEPKMENRKRAGWAIIIFLLIATGLAYGAYRNVWRDVKH